MTIEGNPGELVDRFVDAVNSPDEHDWQDLSFFVVATVGGEEFASAIPDTGPPVPGSYGEKLRETYAVVSREDYFRRMAVRLYRLVAFGLREDFLVRALRDELTARCQELARTEEGDTRVEELRASIERGASDPERIADFRARLAARDPEAGQMTDAEVADRLRSLASRLQPISHDSAKDRWSRVTRWTHRAEAVSDAAIAGWWDRYSAQLMSRS